MPPYDPNGQPSQSTLSVDNTASRRASAEMSYSSGWTTEISGGGDSGFFDLFKLSFKDTNSWQWTNTSENSHSDTQSASVTIGGPSYGYTGPTAILVYYDSLYKTFMFAPVPSGSTPAFKGTVHLSSGKSVAGHEVVLFANGQKYQTITDQYGEFRFFGKFPGPVSIKPRGLAGRTFKLLPSRELNFVL
jgi:hypothetical protein